MSFSINNNHGANIALQVMNATNAQMSTTQNRISTGLKVASTKDDSATFAIAESMRGDLGGMNAVGQSLSRAKSVLDVAVRGAEEISSILIEMESKALLAADAGLDAESVAALKKDFNALRDRITSVVNTSVFNNTNLLKGAAASNQVSALRSTLDTDADADAFAIDKVTVSNVGLDLGGTVITLAAADTFTDATSAATMVAKVRTSRTNLADKLSDLGAAARDVDAQIKFNTALNDVVTAGVSSLVDADLAKESANYQSLQIKQQLGAQALSMANQSPQILLNLFR